MSDRGTAIGDICAGCGKEIDIYAPRYWRTEPRRVYHSNCGDPFGIQAKDAEIRRLRAALEFYANPFAWKLVHDPGDVVRVPDFYSELDFGDRAASALLPSPRSLRETGNGSPTA